MAAVLMVTAAHAHAAAVLPIVGETVPELPPGAAPTPPTPDAVPAPSPPAGPQAIPDAPVAAPPVDMPAEAAPGPTLTPSPDAPPPLALEPAGARAAEGARPAPFYRKDWFWAAAGLVVLTTAVILFSTLGSSGSGTPQTTLGNMRAY
jgi:hypothetical protein